jgi:hypothetical protein
VIIESLVGKIEVTQRGEEENMLNLVSEKRDALESVLNGIELVGGTESENRTFDVEEEVGHFNRFGKIVYIAKVTRSEFINYLNYEVFNFLTYKSINEMRRIRNG